MRDIYGVRDELRKGLSEYITSSRATGKTQKLIQYARDGDTICFIDENSAKHVTTECAKLGISINTIVLKPKDKDSRKMDLYDHEWIVQYYNYMINETHKELFGLPTNTVPENPTLTPPPTRKLNC